MKENEMIYDISAELEQEFGPKGSASRKAAEDKAWEEYNAQILLDARKNAGLMPARMQVLLSRNWQKGLVQTKVMCHVWNVVLPSPLSRPSIA